MTVPVPAMASTPRGYTASSGPTNVPGSGNVIATAVTDSGAPKELAG